MRQGWPLIRWIFIDGEAEREQNLESYFQAVLYSSTALGQLESSKRHLISLPTNTLQIFFSTLIITLIIII